MEKIIYSLLSAVIVSIVIDVLLPDGEIRKYSKFIIGIVISMMILSNIISVINKNKDGISNNYNIILDESYMVKIENDRADIFKNGIKEYLAMNDINCTVKVKLNGVNIQTIELMNVPSDKVHIAELLTSNLYNIDKKDVIVNGK